MRRTPIAAFFACTSSANSMTIARFTRCVITAAMLPSTTLAQDLRLTVYEPLTGPDSLLVFPADSGPRMKRPIVVVRNPIVDGADVPNTGYILAAYVVSSTGTVVPGSVSILESSHRGFVAAMCAVAHKQKFEPLMYDGRPRRALVLVPVGFSPGSRPPMPDLAKWHKLPPHELIDAVSRAPRCPRK